MLILSRKPGESIHIGDDIIVDFFEISGNQIKIGIRAPKDVNIRRSELPPLEPKKANKCARAHKIESRSSNDA